MKKAIMITLIVLCLSSFSIAAENSIESMLGVPFGKSCSIKAEFIDKDDGYYSKNISKAEYYLKIHEVNDKKVAESFIAEPICENVEPEKGKIYELKAYEKIKFVGAPEDWPKDNSEEVKEQRYYGINHYVVIRTP